MAWQVPDTYTVGQLLTATSMNKISGDLTSLNTAGVINAYAGSAAPTGWLLCDGASLLRASFADLFTAISTNYGSADGTHFNVPDLRGRVAVGLGTNASVNALNAKDAQAVGDRRPHHRTTNALSATQAAHNHTATSGTGFRTTGGSNGGQSFNDPAGDQLSGATLNTATPVITMGGSIGSNVSTDSFDTPSFVVVNYIIKTGL